VSHPSLGLPPSDTDPASAAAAARIVANRQRLGARALRAAMDADPTMEQRHDETGLRNLLRDAELLADRVALCVATNEPDRAREYGEWTAALYRRRRVPMDDMVGLCEGLRTALTSVLAPGEIAPAGAALDEAIKVYRWHRRLAGDARKRNALLQLIYKGG
jgi:hypothetical protein